MEQQINMITLGVNDLAGMTNWYKEKFGWELAGNNADRVFFRLGNFILALVCEEELAKDLFVWQDGSGFKRFSFAIRFQSEKEVDNIFSDLQKKGVMIIQEPQKFSGGTYRGYITDPEDNFWELAFYPFIEMGRIQGRPVPEIISGLQGTRIQ